MATVTGSVLDFKLDSLTDSQVEFVLTPSGPGVNASAFLATRPIRVTPGTDGTWSQYLAATTTVSPDVWYNVRVEWLDPLAGYIGLDLPDWKLRVPEEGGAFADLIIRPLGPGETWISSDDSTDPPGSMRGDFVYNPTTADLTRIA